MKKIYFLIIFFVVYNKKSGIKYYVMSDSILQMCFPTSFLCLTGIVLLVYRCL